MKKRGQLDIGFGMIFSIILIIAFIGIAIYVVMAFLNTSNCANIGLFYNDIEAKINSAWSEVEVQYVFTDSVPGTVQKVCFGNTTMPAVADSTTEYEQAKIYFATGHNLFLFPLVKKCEANLGSQKLAHVTTDNFFCVNAVKGKISVKLSKTSSDSLVKLSE